MAYFPLDSRAAVATLTDKTYLQEPLSIGMDETMYRPATDYGDIRLIRSESMRQNPNVARVGMVMRFRNKTSEPGTSAWEQLYSPSEAFGTSFDELTAVLLSSGHIKEYINSRSGALKELFAQQKEKALQRYRVQRNLSARLDALKAEALNEGLIISAESLSDLQKFVRANGIAKRPLVSLLDNGLFRALWHSSIGEQVGIRFCGDGAVQFVFAVKRHNGQFTARITGTDTIEAVWKSIQSNKLTRLLGL